LRTASPKLELLHSCVPKLELGNKKLKSHVYKGFTSGCVPKLELGNKKLKSHVYKGFTSGCVPKLELGNKKQKICTQPRKAVASLLNLPHESISYYYTRPIT